MSTKYLSKLTVIVLVVLVVALSWSKSLSELAGAQVDTGLKRSVVSFAAARTLNAVISVVQGTEVVIQPLGVGVTLTLGQVLDPINDLVEQFSFIMLMASVAFGIQKLLLTIGSTWVVSALVTGLGLVWSVLYWYQRVPLGLSRFLVVVVFIRFVMPVATIGSAYVFDQFSAAEYEASLASIKQTGEELRALGKEVTTLSPEGAVPKPMPDAANPTAAEPKGLLERAKEAIGGATNAVGSVFQASADKVRAKFESIKAQAERTAERMISLIVIFLMQTIVVPLILLLVLYRLLNSLVPRARP